MDGSTFKRHGTRWALAIAGGVALILGGLELAERETSEDASASKHEPAVVEPVGGSDLQRVRLSTAAAERIGLRTAQVRGRTVPYSAILYDEHGKAWVFKRTGRLTFLRAPVEVDTIRGGIATFTAGPPPGTAVVTVGAAELYGAELGVDH